VDGYRCQLHIAHGTVKAYTRRGFDWVNRFRAVADAAKALPAREVIIDGEVIVAGTDGQSDFGALQEHLRMGSSSLLTYYAFDLLHIDGHDLREPRFSYASELCKRC
jgi:bifunctional non-homologous end joining protein LigD